MRKQIYLLIFSPSKWAEWVGFKLQTEAYTSILGLLTDSLTGSSVRIMFLKLGKGGKSYSGQTLTRFQAAGHLANAPWRQ